MDARGELGTLIEALKQEGVERGRQEELRIQEEARREAARMIEGVRREADLIVETAQAKARETLAHLDQQLALALRDMVLRAKAELEELIALRPLARSAERALADPEFLKKLIFTIVEGEAKARAPGAPVRIRVTIPQEQGDAFGEEWIAMMSRELSAQVALVKEQGLGGFKIAAEGAGGELVVDAASIVDVMKSFVSERFHRLLDEPPPGPA